MSSDVTSATDPTRTATRSCRTRKRVIYVYSPGVATTRHVWPATVTAAAAAAAAAAVDAVHRQCDD